MYAFLHLITLIISGLFLWLSDIFYKPRNNKKARIFFTLGYLLLFFVLFSVLKIKYL